MGAVHVECQEDGQVAWSEECKLLEYHRGRGVFYPLIQVRKQASLASHAPGTGEAEVVGSHFATTVALAGGALLFFYELGVNSSSNPLLRAALSCALLVFTVFSAERVRLSRKNPQSSRGLEERLASLLGLVASRAGTSTTKSEHASQAVQAISWHPHLNTFAVAQMDAYKDGSSEYVAFYDMNSEQWLPTVVKHQFQRVITCLQFQPNAGGTIAVGCEEGICLWNFEPAHLVSPAAPNLHGPDTALSAWMSWCAPPPRPHSSFVSTNN